MSETPQERVSRWLNDPLVDLADTEVRKAIRAVLAENEAFMSYEPCPKCGCGVTASCYGCRLKAAEAERDALRLDLAEACRGAAVLARERNEAQGERDALRIDLQTADDQLRALRLLTSPTDYDMYLKVREDALREGKAERDALRAEVGRLRAETADLWNKWSDAEEKRERAEAREHSERAQHFMRRMDKAEAALRIIAGEAQCVDNLMSNVEVARAALRDTAPRYAPGMNVSDHKPHCDILTTRDGWDADCTCDTAPAEGFFARGEDGQYRLDPAPTAPTEERHWQNDADPNPGRAQAAYQAEQARVAEGTVGGVSTISPRRKP